MYTSRTREPGRKQSVAVLQLARDGVCSGDEPMLSRLMTRQEQLVLVFFASAIVIGSLALYVHDTRSGTSPEVSESGESSNAARVVPTPAAVSIVGAVTRPGVYSLSSDARVNDLIKAAGGATELADLGEVNLAAHLVDGTTLTIPFKMSVGDEDLGAVSRRYEATGDLNPAAYRSSGRDRQSDSVSPGLVLQATEDSKSFLGRRVDLNLAGPRELESLPGIGPKLAQSIMEYRRIRPFSSVDELLNVRGIGESRLAAVRDLVVVTPQ